MRKRGQNRERTVLCAICTKPFLTKHSQAKYCSPEHAREGARASWRAYGDRNRKARQEYANKYYLENRDDVIVKTNVYHQSPAGKKASKVSGQRQREKFPEKYAARQAVLIALRSGRLVRQSCKCGKTITEAHHPDYSKPLEVEWLCGRCHRIEHNLEKFAKTGKIGITIEDGAVIAVNEDPPPAA